MTSPMTTYAMSCFTAIPPAADSLGAVAAVSSAFVFDASRTASSPDRLASAPICYRRVESAARPDGEVDMEEGALLWTPSSALVEGANVTAMIRWLNSRRGLALEDYDALYRWSVRDVDAFWSSMWEYFELGPNAGPALAKDVMPGA